MANNNRNYNNNYSSKQIEHFYQPRVRLNLGIMAVNGYITVLLSSRNVATTSVLCHSRESFFGWKSYFLTMVTNSIFLDPPHRVVWKKERRTIFKRRYFIFICLTIILLLSPFSLSSICVALALYIYIYPTPPPWEGCDTKSIFKQSIAGLNSRYSFSYIGWLNNFKNGTILPYFANGPADLGSIPGRVIPKTQKNGTWWRLAWYSILYGTDQG